jgi:hypothetical protein
VMLRILQFVLLLVGVPIYTPSEHSETNVTE